MNADDTQPDGVHPDPPRRTWPRWWQVYLVLLVVSFLVQLRTDGPGPLPPGYESIELITQRSDGPIDTEPADDRERRITVTPETITLAYQDAGPKDGPVIVLLHGSPGKGADFKRTDNGLIPSLAAQGYRVIAPDMPGFGYSEPYIPDYSNRAHARYVLDLLDQLDIDEAHFLGWSMGGGTAIQFYDLVPDRVRSITLMAAIGVQSAEGSGDYYFEHLKYGVGYLFLVGGVEFVPHFGLLKDRSFRHAFMRNFWDNDQRPNRAILERYDKPMLIIHGEADPPLLTPVRVAYEHHDIVQQSELVVYAHDDFASAFYNHAMPFTENGNQRVLDALLPFLDKHNDWATPARRSTLDRGGGIKEQTLTLPGSLELRETMSPWLKAGVIMLGTFILEDPTSIAVGLFIKAGQIDPFVGGFAVLLGIFLGDFGLYMIGFLAGRSALRWRPIAAWVPTRHVEKLGAWFDAKGWKAVLASRFIPGSRLPLYIAAGVTGNKPGRFMLWTLMAVCVWVPVILFSVILLGEAARSPFQMILDFGGWPAFVGVVLVLMVLMNILLSLVTREGRRKLAIRLQKQARYEYWPGWKFYLPMVPYWLYLMIKYRSTTVWTLANPCMPDGGVVGESKSDILSRIDDPAVLKHELIPEESEPSDRMARTKGILAERGWTYPIILKPDAAQRGAGVTLVKSEGDIAGFFNSCEGPAQLQQYHPGPFECGIFYTRHPNEEHGKIFSITDKAFPILVGDGKSSLEELIWQHPRFRFQHDVFHIRWADELERVLDKGEELRLAEAGNHCQGTLFRDGARLITPDLERRIDELAKRLEGFYFGRLDIRYTDEAALKCGEGLALIEINGVTSESTNLYDPTWSLWQAHATLRAQWAECFAIGEAIRKRDGVKPKPGLRLLRDSLRYYRGRHVSTLSD
ncbi:MAG: alpha/beta fold hydrolase [Phycisphaeraceae bacterium]|nr:alpha/beta fold hydrolase [Phycisphaeraceae bacterium]